MFFYRSLWRDSSPEVVQRFARAPRGYRQSSFFPGRSRDRRRKTLSFFGPVRIWWTADINLITRPQSEAWAAPWIAQPDFAIEIGVKPGKKYPNRPNREAALIGHFMDVGTRRKGGHGVHVRPFEWKKKALYNTRQAFIRAIPRWWLEEQRMGISRSPAQLKEKLRRLAELKAKEAIKLYELIDTGHLLKYTTARITGNPGD